jgi:hypothetical protein
MDYQKELSTTTKDSGVKKVKCQTNTFMEDNVRQMIVGNCEITYKDNTKNDMEFFKLDNNIQELLIPQINTIYSSVKHTAIIPAEDGSIEFLFVPPKNDADVRKITCQINIFVNNNLRDMTVGNCEITYKDNTQNDRQFLELDHNIQKLLIPQTNIIYQLVTHKAVLADAAYVEFIFKPSRYEETYTEHCIGRLVNTNWETLETTVPFSTCIFVKYEDTFTLLNIPAHDDYN